MNRGVFFGKYALGAAVVFIGFSFAGSLTAQADTQGLSAAVDPNWVSSQLSQLTVSPLALKVQASGYEAAVNPTILQLFASDPNYTHTLTTGSIMNQNDSGDCWIYSSLSVLRSRLYTDRGVDQSFQFSPTYVYFYSLLEKTNLFLNTVIKLRDKHMSLQEIQNKLNPTTGIQDGGYWESFVFLAEKYGLVPTTAMPDTWSTGNDAALLQDLGGLVSADIQQIYKASQNPDPSLSDRDQLSQLYALKTTAIANALRVIEAHLGKPPTTFTYNGTSYTPMSFFKNFVNIDFNDYVHVAGYPTLGLDRHYAWKQSEIGTPDPKQPLADVSFLNMTHDRMAELVTNSVLIDYAPWIAIDVMEDVDTNSGIMHPQIFDLADFYQLPAGTALMADPSVGMKLGILSADHAVAIVGVDQPSPASPATKFEVENSWGTTVGTKGFFHMYREWFDQYVFDVVVPKSLLSPEELQELQAPAIPVNGDLSG